MEGNDLGKEIVAWNKNKVSLPMLQVAETLYSELMPVYKGVSISVRFLSP